MAKTMAGVLLYSLLAAAILPLQPCTWSNSITLILDLSLQLPLTFDLKSALTLKFFYIPQSTILGEYSNCCCRPCGNYMQCFVQYQLFKFLVTSIAQYHWVWAPRTQDLLKIILQTIHFLCRHCSCIDTDYGHPIAL